MIMKTFSQRLRELRLEKGLRQIDIANGICVTINAICNYEAGIREPSLDMLIKICRFLETDPNYILGFSDY